ncbi:MAG: aminoglycoside phosphotransferase family protein [Thermoleophilia bacterium]
MSTSVEVRHLAARHHVMMVRDGDARSCHKRTPPGGEPAALTREVRVLAIVQRHLPGLAPRVLGHDPSSRTLRVEWVGGATGAEDPAALLDPGTASVLGAALGALHGLAADDLAPLPRPFTVHRPTPTDLRAMTGGELEMLRVLQGSDLTCVTLDGLREGWDACALIHGDVAAHHIVPGRDGAPLRLLDWDQAGMGDPAWDVACALACHLGVWLDAVDTNGSLRCDDTHAANRALVAAWSKRRDAQASPARLAALVGARLVQLAFGRAGWGDRPDVVAIRYAQVAANVMAQPDVAATALLGLDLV